jgi:putative transcriptional regulator
MKKGESTKMQVLVEIASLQPHVRQKEIAERVGVTPQSVSEYVKELVAEGYVRFGDRGKYEVTKHGIELILSWANELEDYVRYITEDIIGKVTVWTAIADEDLKGGSRVGLKMRDGILHAFDYKSEQVPATGIVIGDVVKGEDTGIHDLEGMIPMDRAHVTIAIVPRIQRGGSRLVDLNKLKHIGTEQPIAVVGLEALIAVKKAGLSPTIMYGIKEAVVEAAFRGVSTLVVAVDEEVPNLISRLISEDIPHDTIDFRKLKKA